MCCRVHTLRTCIKARILKGHGFSRAGDAESERGFGRQGKAKDWKCIPSGAEAQISICHRAARLKSCPFKSQFSPLAARREPGTWARRFVEKHQLPQFTAASSTKPAPPPDCRCTEGTARTPIPNTAGALRPWKPAPYPDRLPSVPMRRHGLPQPA